MNNPELTLAEFEALRKVIRTATGIAMSEQKRELVAGRLAPRLRALSLSTFSDYLRFLSADATGAETNELVNRITTNKSSFFREPHHFDVLRTRLIPDLLDRAAAPGGQKRIRIWSAACSNGQEPWSLAMTIADALGSLAGWDIRILASDLDTNVLATAERATYDEIATDDIPAALRAKYLEPAGNGESRVIAPLRSLVTFRRLNLVEPSSWNVRTRFDAILCRNVAIYFDRPTQEVLFRGLAALLEPTGYLMSGHSENLHWLSSVLRPVGNTVHVLASAATSQAVVIDAPPPPPSVRASMSPHVSTALSPVLSARPKAQPASGLRRSVPIDGKREIAIQVGGIHASARGAIVRTTLGSCVAACLYDLEAGIGGMNHFLLPEDRSGIRGPTNFGVHAMEMLINSIMKLGGDRRRFVAKLFGGADQQIASAMTVGQKNAEFAIRFLEEEGIPIVGQKIGGSAAMMVVFDTATGKAQVKTLERSQEVASAERSHVASLAKQAQTIPDDITFFGS